MLVLSWGGTYGSCITAVNQCQAMGLSVAHAHLRYLHPFPRNLSEILDRYEKILIPELNMGQLHFVIRGKFLKDAIAMNKMEGKPFTVTEIVDRIQQILS